MPEVTVNSAATINQRRATGRTPRLLSRMAALNLPAPPPSLSSPPGLVYKGRGAQSNHQHKERPDGSAQNSPRRPALLQRPDLEGLHGPDGRYAGPHRGQLRQVRPDRRG